MLENTTYGLNAIKTQVNTVNTTVINNTGGYRTYIANYTNKPVSEAGAVDNIINVTGNGWIHITSVEGSSSSGGHNSYVRLVIDGSEIFKAYGNRSVNDEWYNDGTPWTGFDIHFKNSLLVQFGSANNRGSNTLHCYYTYR